MNLQLSPEQEQLIAEAVQAGIIRSASDIVQIGIEEVRQQLKSRMPSGPEMNASQWSQQLHEWIESHPTTTPLLSDEAIDRDSIYGTRGM